MLKHLLFIAGIIILLFIASKIFLWALKSVFIIGLIAIAGYFVLRFFAGNSRKT